MARAIIIMEVPAAMTVKQLSGELPPPSPSAWHCCHQRAMARRRERTARGAEDAEAETAMRAYLDRTKLAGDTKKDYVTAYKSLAGEARR